MSRLLAAIIIAAGIALAGAASRPTLPRGLDVTPDGRLMIKAGTFRQYPPCVEPPCDTPPGSVSWCPPKCAATFGLAIDFAWEAP